jgi:hypothetical protein
MARDHAEHLLVVIVIRTLHSPRRRQCVVPAPLMLAGAKYEARRTATLDKSTIPSSFTAPVHAPGRTARIFFGI